MEDRTLLMSLRDHLRGQACQQLLAGQISEKEAAERLDLGIRQVRRLKKRVKKEGLKGVIHKLKGRPSARRVTDDILQQVRDLYQTTYCGWNMAHFNQRLSRAHGIVLSSEMVRQILLDDPSRPRRSKRRKHRRYRARRASLGELVQMDASLHPWLGEGGEQAVLICAVDDATGQMLWGEFSVSDGTIENLRVVRRIVKKYGIAKELYLDRSPKYFPEEQQALEAREQGKEALTQFGRAMKELGIGMIKARSPQAKGRIERLFKTLQDRLVKELALEGIKTIQEANRYLQAVFVPRFNKDFGVSAEGKHSAFVRVPAGFDYNGVFCLKETRTVQNDYTISYEGAKIQLDDMSVWAGQKVEVRVWLDATVHVYCKGKPVKAQKVLKKAG